MISKLYVVFFIAHGFLRAAIFTKFKEGVSYGNMLVIMLYRNGGSIFIGVGSLLFLLIPMVAIGVSQGVGAEKLEFTAYTPFIATILFYLVGYYFDAFAISWLFFLLIPIAGVIEDQIKPKKVK